MKKNKTIAYMLAATLLVGGTFVGTKALFTDEVSTAGELSISTGDLDIEVTGGEWERITSGQDPVEGVTDGVDFDNLKTGDILEKEITVKNNGTLIAEVKLEETNNHSVVLPKGIEYTAVFDNNKQERTFNPNEESTVTLQIKVTGGGQHIKNEQLTGNETAEQLNSDAQEKKVLDLKDSYNLTAKQTEVTVYGK